jgi:filamentous hemagglutinin family protein
MKTNHEHKSRFRILKNGKIALIISSLLGTITLVSASPTDGVVTSGTASISQTANSTTITQSSNKASINWQSFSVKPNETVNFVQPNSSSVTLNRVVGVTQSLIEGTINANGQVFLLNPNGIVFSKGSSVNVGGLVASTLKLSDEDFQAGNYSLSGNSTNSILNLGTITANQNGYVVLAGKTVSNEGLIKATLGDIHLVGASQVSLNINGNSLIKLTIDKGILDSLVENKGIIQANGGEVYLTTQALDTVLNGVVNNTGIIEANSIDTHNGKIVLFAHGGTTSVAGTLSSKEGFIETSGKVLGVKESANIQTKKWLLDPTNLTIDSSGSVDTVSATTVQNSLSTADVELQADQDITVAEDITWSEATKLTLTAGDQIFVNAIINNTNATTGGVYFNAANTTNKVVFDTNGKVKVNNTYQLQWMNQALAGKYELGSNIDASATSSWNSGTGFNPIGNITNKFSGSFDGLGHTISNLFINRPTTDYVGLFGYATTGLTLQNVGLINVDITGQHYVGGFVGYNRRTVSNSYTTGTVNGRNSVGGLVGSNEIDGSITNSYSAVNVSSNVNSENIGGLVGFNFGSVVNSYAIGSVNGDIAVGGLVGHNSYGSITNSYAIGSVNGNTAAGGLVGWNEFSSIINSYWDIDTTTRTSGVGIDNGSTTNLIGVHSTTPTIDAFTQATYSNLDFTNTWYMIDGETRPFLRSEYSTTISNDHQLQLMAMNLGANYTLANDITYSGDMWSSRGFNPIGNASTKFSGSFDGLGHTISDLFIDRSTTDYVGLFGYTDTSMNIQNIGLINVDITGHDYVGGLVGSKRGSIYNSYATGAVNGNTYIGILVGYNLGTITNSYSTGSAYGTSQVGGLVGRNYSAIADSYATGNVSGGDKIGGFVGVNEDISSISNSYATGNVNGTGISTIGGFVGLNYGSISHSYATGNITGTYYVGGFVGENFYATIDNSYATGSVNATGNYVGGFVGNIDGGSITKSYASGHVSGSGSSVGGFAGEKDGSISNSYWDIDTTGKTVGAGGFGGSTGTIGIHSTTSTIDAFTQSTYTGFDFTNDWILYEGNTRPLLRTFMTPLTVTANDATKTYDGNVYNGANGVTYSTTTNSNLLGTLNYGTDKNVGTYTLTPSGLYSNQQGYIISYGNGTLTINPRLSTNNQTLDTFDSNKITQIKTPVQNGVAFKIDNIEQQVNLVNLKPTTSMVNKGMKLPIGLFNNEGF